MWESLEGKILLFPVNDLDMSTGTIKPGQRPTAREPTSRRSRLRAYDCQIDTAYIVGWIQLG